MVFVCSYLSCHSLGLLEGFFTEWCCFHHWNYLWILQKLFTKHHQTTFIDTQKLLLNNCFYTLLKLLCFSEHVWASLLDVYHKNHGPKDLQSSWAWHNLPWHKNRPWRKHRQQWCGQKSWKTPNTGVIIWHQPKKCTIKRKSFKMTIHLHQVWFSPNELMIPDKSGPKFGWKM